MLSSPRGGGAAPCGAGQLQAREVRSALLWSCTAGTFSIPRDAPMPEQWPCTGTVRAVACSQRLMLASTFPFTELITGDRALAGLFSPFPIFFSFSFPFHPHHLSYQVTPSLDLLLYPFYTGDESDVKLPIPTGQLCPSPACTNPRGFTSVTETLQQ